MVFIGVWPLSTNTMGIKTRLCFTGEELWRWKADVISRGRHDLIDNYTREEIKVRFILDCLYAESKKQRTSDAHDIMVTSVLEFISKIPGQSDLYTTPVYRDRIGRIQTRTPTFEFILAFRDRRHKNCLSVARDMLFLKCYQVLWRCHHQKLKNT